jgi:hypothetical protein
MDLATGSELLLAIHTYDSVQLFIVHLLMATYVVSPHEAHCVGTALSLHLPLLSNLTCNSGALKYQQSIIK